MQINSEHSFLLAATLGKPGRAVKSSTDPQGAATPLQVSDSQAGSDADPESTPVAQTRVLPQFTTGRDVANAVSFGQTQQAYLQMMRKALSRMSELAVQAQDKSLSSSELEEADEEFSDLGEYIELLASKDFNGFNLFVTPGRSQNPGVRAGGPSMSPVNLSVQAYARPLEGGLTDAGSARDASAATQAALSQLATEELGVTKRVDTLFSIAGELSELDPQPVTAELSNPAAETRWADSVPLFELFAQPGMALSTQANVSPSAVSRLLA